MEGRGGVEVWLSISVHHPPMWTRPFVSTRKHDFQLQTLQTVTAGRLRRRWGLTVLPSVFYELVKLRNHALAPALAGNNFSNSGSPSSKARSGSRRAQSASRQPASQAFLIASSASVFRFSTQ